MAIQIISHIDVTPGYLGGAPRISGSRISVHHIIVMVEQLGVSPEEVIQQYHLTPGQFYAALSYYHDHQAEIDRFITREEDLLEKARTIPSSTQEARIRMLWQEKSKTQSLEDEKVGEMTVKEISEEYNVDESTVREAAKKGWVRARKSGATWLIRRNDAESRWGERHRM